MAKGGSQTTEVKIPEWLEEAAQRALSRSEATANLGFQPWMGPDVAALTPSQEAAMRNTNASARAFGLQGGGGVRAGMGKPTDYGAVQGYSAFPLYEQAQAAYAERYPDQQRAYENLYNPRARWLQDQIAAGQAGDGAQQPVMTSGSGGTDRLNTLPAPGANPNPYTSFGDMFDGGGPGTSGDTYEGGGPISWYGNRLTGSR